MVRRSTERDLQAHGRTGRTGADLNQVAELIREPEPAATFLRDRRSHLPCERRGDPTGVLDLDREAPPLQPGAQGAAAIAVDDAVGGQLAGRDDEIGPGAAAKPSGVGSL